MGQFTQYFHSRNPWHGQIEQQNIGLQLGCQRDGLLSVCGLGDHGEIFLSGQQTAQSVAEDGVIISDQDTNWIYSHISGDVGTREVRDLDLQARALPGFRDDGQFSLDGAHTLFDH